MIPIAPKKLSAESRRIWTMINKEWDLDDSALVLLEQALRCHDRVLQARALIDEQGLTVITGNGMMRKHPACEIEKEARSGFLQAWRMLNLGIDPPGPIGRPGCS